MSRASWVRDGAARRGVLRALAGADSEGGELLAAAVSANENSTERCRGDLEEGCMRALLGGGVAGALALSKCSR